MDKWQFDIVAGNVPWDRSLDKKFLTFLVTDVTAPGGTIGIITSASWLSEKSTGMRELVISNGDIEKIWIYPADVFINPETKKPIKGTGAGILYTTGQQYNKETQLVRYMDSNVFETTTNFSRDGTILYICDEGKEIYDICVTNNASGNIPKEKYSHSNHPKIHFNTKLDLNYVGSIIKLKDITGKRILTGVTVDLDGNNGWTATLKTRSDNNNAAKRLMIEFPPGDTHLAVNAAYHLGMRVFGLLLAMSSTIAHVSSRTLFSLKLDLLQEEYDSQEQYENAYYNKMEFSPEQISWIQTVGIDNIGDNNKKYKNLSDDDTLDEIKRDKTRIKETGELFTPKGYIDDIIDALELKGLCDPSKRFLEPSFGDGNFLIVVIQRKIKSGMTIINALKTTYGIELKQDNVDLCHKRILNIVGDGEEYMKIIKNNIVQGDSIDGWDYKNWAPKKNSMDLLSF